MSNNHQTPYEDFNSNNQFIPFFSNITDISLISVNWNDIYLKPSFCNIIFTSSYADLLNKPLFFPIATSGDYNDIFINKTWISNNNNIYNFTGNVGIGNSNPLFKVDVIGNINFNGSLYQNGSEYQNSQWITISSNIYYDIGNIGIGKTTDISESLDINGNIRIAGNIFPNDTNNYNLGTSNYRWKDLYLSSNSIYLDNFAISKNNSNNNLIIKDSNNNFTSLIINNIDLNNDFSFSLNQNGNLIYTKNNVIYYPLLLDNPYQYSNIVLSNVFLASSNSIYTKITNLSTDTIISGSSNRFITNDIYNRDINFTQNLTASNITASNLTIIGDTTILNTNVYQTKQLQIINDTTATPFITKQLNTNYNIAEFYNNTTSAFIINSNGNIGANNNNPLYTFDINGSLNTNNDIFINNTNVSNIIDDNLTINSNYLIDYNNHTNKPILSTIAINGNYDDLTNKPWINSINNIYNITSSFIGIGKTNPLYKLDINGSLNTNNEIFIKNNNFSNIIDTKIIANSNVLVNYNNHTNKPILASVAISGSFYDINNRPNQYGEFSNYNNLINRNWSNNNNNLYNLNTGFIGIGISNPLYTIDINGSLNTNNEIFIKNNNISNIIDTKITINSNYLINYNNHINKPVLATVASSSNYNDLNNKPSLSAVALSGNYNDLINNSWINSGNNIYTNNSGYIGIGTDNPQYKLDISGDINTNNEMFIKNTNISNVIDSNIISSSNSINSKINNLNTDTITLGTNNRFIINDTYNRDILFTQILTSSNIITSNISVLGDSTVFNTTVYQTEQLQVNNNTSYPSLVIKQINATQNVFETYSNNQQNFIINSIGNIGISTNNPLYKLHINGSLNTNEVYIKNLNISNIIDDKIINTSNILINYNNRINKPILSTVATTGNYNDLINNLWINDTNNNIYNTNSGFVGIGKTNPLYKLDINGDVNSTEYFIKGTNISNIIDNKLTTTSNILINYNNLINKPILSTVATTGNYTNLINKPSNGVSDYNLLSNMPWINSGNNIYSCNGFNIGIGKTNPQYKLDVIGDINITGSLRISNSIVPFSTYSNTNIVASNATFGYSNSSFGYYMFLTNGSITFPQTTICDILVVGAGGNGGLTIGSGGGGAGEVIYYPNYSLTQGTYNLTIGYSSQNTISKNTRINYNNTDIIIATGGGNGIDASVQVFTHFLQTKKPWGCYFAENFSGSTLFDSSGNNRHATSTGTITKATASGNGATANITYISGGTSSYIIFPTGSIPSTFTILSLSRYTGSSSCTRIVQAMNGNFLHGHWNNRRGVCHYDAWKTPEVSVGTLTDWLCCIGKNSGSTPGNILIDGIGRGNNTGGIGGYTLAINNNIYNELSEWAVSCIMVWDQALTDQEMINLNTMINTYKSTGIYSISVTDTNTNFSTILNIGGSSGGGRNTSIITSNIYTNIKYNISSTFSSGATAGTKWNATYSYVSAGNNGTALQGGNGGSAINGGFIEPITGTNLITGIGGTGATATSVPTLRTAYGSGGDGNGGLGTQGIVIIKVPLNTTRTRFDGYINYSNIENRPYINDLIASKKFIDIGYYNQVNFPLANISLGNEWFIYKGTSPTNTANSLVFWHLTSNINSKWWFNGTIANTNNEISDERVKKEITTIANPLEKIMLLQPKEYMLCDDKNYLKKYGIIAQDVKQTLPDFVYTDEDYIANIYTNAIYSDDNNIYKLQTTKDISNLISIHDELKLLLDNNDKSNIEIIIEDLPYHNRYKKRFVIVKSIIDNYTIEITEKIEATEVEKLNIFIYGKKVSDFLKLDYSSLYTLTISATQKLYNIYLQQKAKLIELNQYLENSNV